ncbi:MAG: hypothetical protein D3917_00730 [Candidatus Electrothrix sp. AX5]|nr:hypothetical protein [Candidatus Electrothrix sp. AX5]
MKIQKRLIGKMIFPEKPKHTAPGISGSGCIKNEQGFVLVLSLMVLVVLTLLGISASRTSVIELEITGNDNLAKMLLYYAESAAYEVAQRLENINQDDAGTEECPTYPLCLMHDEANSPPWMFTTDADADIDLNSVLENNSKKSIISPPDPDGDVDGIQGNVDGIRITVDMVAINRGRYAGESLTQYPPKTVSFEIIGRATRTEGSGKTIEKMVEIGYRKNLN